MTVVVVGFGVVGFGVVGFGVVGFGVVGFGVVVVGFSLGGSSSNNSHREKIFFGEKCFLLGKISGIRCSSTSSHWAIPCHTAWIVG